MVGKMFCYNDIPERLKLENHHVCLESLTIPHEVDDVKSKEDGGDPLVGHFQFLAWAQGTASCHTIARQLWKTPHFPPKRLCVPENQIASKISNCICDQLMFGFFFRNKVMATTSRVASCCRHMDDASFIITKY